MTHQVDGVSHNTHAYLQPEEGLHAFLVRFTGLDGTTSLSEVEYITVGDLGAFSVFPIPFEEELTVVARNPISSKANFELTDIQGKSIWTTNMDISTGEEISLKVPRRLPAGTYLLTISTQQEQSQIQVIKK